MVLRKKEQKKKTALAFDTRNRIAYYFAISSLLSEGVMLTKLDGINFGWLPIKYPSDMHLIFLVIDDNPLLDQGLIYLLCWIDCMSDCDLLMNSIMHCI